MMVIVAPIIYKGEKRISLTFKYDLRIITKIKQIPGARYSATGKCWHVEYSKQHWKAIKNLGLPYQISLPTGTTDSTMSSSVRTGISDLKKEHAVLPKNGNGATDIQLNKEKLAITFSGNHFQVTCRYEVADVAFIKSLKGSWWHQGTKTWVVKGRLEHLQALQEQFNYWSEEDYGKISELLNLSQDPMVMELYLTPEFPDAVVIKVRGYTIDVGILKQIPGRQYDQALSRWIIPNDLKMITRLIDHYRERGAKIVDRIPDPGSKVEHQGPGILEKQAYFIKKSKSAHKAVIRQYTDVLIAQKYSKKTMCSYAAKFADYLESLVDKPLPQSTAEDVNHYLAMVSKQVESDSTMNVIISAIKFYYERVVFMPAFKIERIKRPRKRRYLPTILSTSEVDRMLRMTQNKKHLAILYALYGSGMRLGELLNLQVPDILWDRNQIHVRKGKGNRDRMVMLSQTLKEILRLYFDEYMPSMWLFEGQNQKKPYSGKSVQSIVKKVASEAGIIRRTTPHTLRHCFATHLMDGGVQLPYIQQLLGHKDIKTTLIYTHVTTQNATSISSPLDRLRDKENPAKNEG
jgi:site-specific recombinase XerD